MSFELIPKEVVEILKIVYGDAFQPGTQAIGDTIGQTLRFVTLPFRCLGMTVDVLEENYKQFIVKTLRKVPSDNLQVPPANIAGPIFDNIKYRFEEPEIVEMFSELLSSSMDSENSIYVHPSYVYIIQQMSSDDAKLFNFFTQKSLRQGSRTKGIRSKEIPMPRVAQYCYEEKIHMLNSLSNLILLDVIEDVSMIDQRTFETHKAYLSKNQEKALWESGISAKDTSMYARVTKSKGFFLSFKGLDIARIIAL